jgi:hypothetical protein
MNYEPIRDRIGVLLKEVEGIGKVFPSPRFTSDWAPFLNRFAITHPYDASKRLICVAWYTRVAATERDTGIGIRDESRTLVVAERDEQWRISLVYGFSDDDDSPSETGYQMLVDRIQEKFRWEDRLGIPADVFESHPLSLTVSELRFFGEVLCHYAEFTLRVIQQIARP